MGKTNKKFADYNGPASHNTTEERWIQNKFIFWWQAYDGLLVHVAQVQIFC